MALLAHTFTTSSFAGPFLPAAPPKSVSPRPTKLLCSALHEQQEPLLSSHYFRRLLPSLSNVECKQGVELFSQLLPNYGCQVKNSSEVIELWKQFERLATTTTLGASLLLVTLPANALSFDLPPLPPDFLETLISWAVIAFLYLFVAPFIIYYYLEQRWFKRKMAEAIFQFGIVFLFFPGMLLLAPFLNFRKRPESGAKEPWDEIRP